MTLTKTVITIYVPKEAKYSDATILRAFMVVKPNHSTKYFIEETIVDLPSEVSGNGFTSFISKNKLSSTQNSIVLNV